MLCLGCGLKSGFRAGLCDSCYHRKQATSPARIDPEDEWTEDELEALIAEQSRPENLPSWWERDARLQNAEDVTDRISWLFRRGRV